MTTTTTTPAAAALPELRAVPIDQLKEHPLNARKTFDPGTMAELEASIRDHGIRTPLQVRANGRGYEIIGGHRRYRCAKAIGLAEVPVLVQKLDDDAALELMLIDNLQREGLHPLEEAAGYQQLMVKSKYDVARIAERVGRSVKYVYDRVKLLSLTKEAQKLFRDGEITAGHAILLARLSPADQKRAIGDLEDTDEDWQGRAGSPLFRTEQLLFREEDEDKRGNYPSSRRSISVRELGAWIDANVRLDAREADPMLFPDLVQTVKAADEIRDKVIPITYEDVTPEAAKEDGPRPVLGRSWARADGKFGSKGCDYSAIGTVIIGPGRGDAIRVCVDKRKCATHWPDQVKAEKARLKAKADAEKHPIAAAQREKEKAAAQREKEKAEREARELEHLRRRKAEPAVAKALVAVLRKTPAGATTRLGQLVVELAKNSLPWGVDKEIPKYMSAGKTSEDLVRYLGFCDLFSQMREGDPDDFAVTAHAFGVEVKAIIDEASPRPPRCRECGCTEAKACTVTIPGEGPRGCSWLEDPDPKTGLGLCSAPKCARTRRPGKPAAASKRAKHKLPAKSAKRKAA